MDTPREYAPGDIAQGHVWTGSDWIPVLETSSDESDSYHVGAVVNDHVWTGDAWLPVRRLGAASVKKGFRERWEEAQRLEEEKQIAKLQGDPIFTQCGRCVAEGVVAGRRVKIYEKGFVQVGMFKLGPPERLLGITASDMTSQKTGLGRAVVGAVTLGANVMLTPNKRGSFYLVIVTDRKTHTLTMSPPTNSDLKAMHKLEGAGRSVLAARGGADQVPPATSPQSDREAVQPDMVGQLAQLAQLHASGALTDAEFASAKERILGDS